MRVVRIAITLAVWTIVTLIATLAPNPSKVRHSRIGPAVAA